MQRDPDNLRYFNDEIRRLRESDQTRQTTFDGGGGGGYDHPMEERVKKLEDQVGKAAERIVNIERDVAVMRSNYATGKDVSDSKNSIIMWVVGAIFIAQLLPILKDFVKPPSGGGGPTATAPAPSAGQRQAPTPAK